MFLRKLQIFKGVFPFRFCCVFVAHDDHSNDQETDSNNVDVVVGYFLKMNLQNEVEDDLKTSEDVGQGGTDKSRK